MSKGFPPSMSALIAELNKLPGIGPKSAQRLAFFILRGHISDARNLAESILKVKSSVRFCRLCSNLSDNDICEICSNVSRAKDILCVVENPNDVITIEKMGGYHGLYHVLLGALSPLDGIGPKDLRIDSLIERIGKESIKEVILATDSNTEGETTALYLSKILRNTGVKVTRIASGMPVGAKIEYADQATLMRAFEGRLPV